MSRLQTGSMEVLAESADVGELVVEAVDSLGPRGGDVPVTVPPGLPRIHTDPVLVERAVANLVDNALSHAGGRGLRVEAGTVAGRVDIRVIDQGPGIRREDRDVVFQPFQRLGDSDNGTGWAWGWPWPGGSSEAVGGELDVEDTPGGGCTMVRPPPRVARPMTRGRTAAPRRGREAAGCPVGPGRRRRDRRGTAAGTGRDAARRRAARVLVIDDDTVPGAGPVHQPHRPGLRRGAGPQRRGGSRPRRPPAPRRDPARPRAPRASTGST